MTIRRLYRACRLARQLHDEHLAAVEAVDRLELGKKRHFWGLVGHPGQRLDVGGIGLQPIRGDHRTGLYEPTEDGPRAIIFPARNLPHCLGGELVDLVAFLPGSGEIFRRRGVADMLGEWWGSPPVYEAVTVFMDPAEWARSNGAGVVLLDWTNAWSAIGHIDCLAVLDVPAGQRLRSALNPPPAPRRPRILVAEKSVGAAA